MSYLFEMLKIEDPKKWTTFINAYFVQKNHISSKSIVLETMKRKQEFNKTMVLNNLTVVQQLYRYPKN